MKEMIKYLLISLIIGVLVWYISRLLFNAYLPPASNGCLPPMVCDFVDNRPSLYSSISGIVSFVLVFLGLLQKTRKQK